MGERIFAQTVGFVDDTVIGDAKMVNNNTLMAMVKTMAQNQIRTSIKTSLALDGGSVADVFTITTGYVMIYAFIGFVTEAVSANACNMNFGFDPTTGASNTPIFANVDINAMGLGSCFYAEGDATAGVIVANGTDTGSAMTTPILGPPGGIDMTLANSDPTSGIADVIIQYRPLTADAYIVAN